MGPALRGFSLPPQRATALTGSFVRKDGPAPVFLVRVGPDGRSLGSPAHWRTDLWHGTGPPDLDRVVVAAADVPEGTLLYASATARDVTPVRVEGIPDPLAEAGSARHVILAVPPLVDAAQRLARHRTATGLPSAVVPVTDVATKRYGHGEAGAAAVRAFVEDLEKRPGAPLAYLLLAGDATLDRTDMADFVTIPAPSTPTMYNGATASDHLYVEAPDDPAAGPAVGRLPFRDADTMSAFVDRLIRYETSPPADPTRRLLRFITSEGRFGPLVDSLLEGKFRHTVADDVPPAFDVDVTFASAKSPFLWPPPEFGQKVVEGFDEGALFTTYVGHGYAEGFDSLRVGRKRYPILTVEDAPKIHVKGTPPVVFVLACTTAIFDRPGPNGVGEALLANPNGPIAYVGATRIYHPGGNVLLGDALARSMADDVGGARLGSLLSNADRETLHPTHADTLTRTAIGMLSGGASADRLALEAVRMYALLGDPGTRIAFPRPDVHVVKVAKSEAFLDVDVEAPLPDGAKVTVTLEVPRDRDAHEVHPVPDPGDPASFAQIRENHRLANDPVLARTEVVLAAGRAHARLPRPDGDLQGLVLKAWSIAAGDVHQGAAVLDD